ncbi:MAG: AAA family ATPase [Sulfitobacter sp.]
MHKKNILISGCSGGGKSSLLEVLCQRGYPTVPEPGRRIVNQERSGTGRALPWVNLSLFAQRALALAQADLAAAQNTKGFVFFDRGLIDAAVALKYAGGPHYRTSLAGQQQYARRVYVTPPWPEIYVTDADRKHSMDDAKTEYLRLNKAFFELGYDICELPKTSVCDRANFILADLGIA